jgi:hypothetical protein
MPRTYIPTDNDEDDEPNIKFGVIAQANAGHIGLDKHDECMSEASYRRNVTYREPVPNPRNKSI